MESSIAILSVISGSASIAGLLIELFGKKGKMRSVLVAMFVLAVSFSVYILIFPGSNVVKNVKNKINYYSKQVSDDTLIQEGTFSFSGYGPYSVQFYEPYKEAPTIYLINENGYKEIEIPTVEYVSNHYFKVKRHGSTGLELTPMMFQTYKWVAEGRPFLNKSN